MALLRIVNRKMKDAWYYTQFLQTDKQKIEITSSKKNTIFLQYVTAKTKESCCMERTTLY
ncbi:MAG: hypothetical protein GY749_28155 [Desulfobacteraceae bacterium]|nr:hypothetical protein [Desulfobacteraceae bacterium]